ncbi:trk-type k+ transporter, membrane component [Halogeometricum pallidum JCM 14848]|uniref:Trk-type k+ transporter, membrane component n=1 Tax=Halogeometricum pallidum JCM 14848 TaxID=1227487 RepID=M0CVS0_HALPD|nr:potassium transporter TrkG [Halogeometricum pallidum]ELZ26743.1 trk-type k+ transporter, membrane component [Halogeometricum pallidum JCM 14848]
MSSSRRPTVAGWPADLATIARDVGSLLTLESVLMTVSVLVALAFREWYVALAFLTAGGVTAAVGLGARTAFAEAPNPRMKHGMIIAAGGWLMTAVFGSLPFLFAAYFLPPDVAASYVPAGADYAASSVRYFRNPLHALFESMSGWTGSGLTMAVHEPSLPRGIQWWRSLIQWVGGVGVIVLTVSILARPGSGSYTLYRSEAREEKIHPSIITTVRTVWKIFVAYTVVSVCVLFVAIRLSEYGSQLPLWRAGWQALNHAMTGLSTGGFSVTDNSIATYDSPLIEGVLLPIMALGAIAFPVHYLVLRDRELSHLFEDLQTKWLFVGFAVGIAVLIAQNVASIPATDGAFVGTPEWLGVGAFLGPAAADAFRDSVFQWISALTCTGFQSAPIGRWAAGGKLIVSGAMIVGGAAGSTVGGIKIIRAYTISRGIAWQFSRVFLPANAVVGITMNGRRLDRNEMEREFSEAAIVSILWLIILVASSLLLVNLAAPQFTYADALFEVASAQGNVGLSTGITGPEMNPFAEAMFLLNMWIGRLEIIPVLVFARSVVYGLDP